ncbi:hypothetical protein T492DRAFT_896876 [Pavlovales sp. CCMP2436]|nr:hypothetical protein T492DRAFT_896876 [Pavlovales sp. CCMP2436]
MIQKGEGDAATIAHAREALAGMLAYCENDHLCRRVQQLHYFGERFDVAACNRTCDVCLAGAQHVRTDMSELGQCALRMVQVWPAHTFTMPLLVDALRGSKRKEATKRLDQLPGFGSGAQLRKPDVERMARQLVSCAALGEEHVSSEALGGMVTYLRPGDTAGRLLSGSLRVQVHLLEEVRKGARAQPLPLPLQGQPPQAQGAPGGVDPGGAGAFGGAAPVREPPQLRELLAELESNLTTKRSEVSVILLIEPHTIMDNTLISRIATALPLAQEELLQIEGISEHKAATFAGLILAAVAGFISAHPELGTYAEALRRARQAAQAPRQPTALPAPPAPPAPAPGGGGAAARARRGAR